MGAASPASSLGQYPPEPAPDSSSAASGLFVAEAVGPSPDLGVAEGWVMAELGMASSDSQAGLEQAMQFSCLDLLTAFQGELY